MKRILCRPRVLYFLLLVFMMTSCDDEGSEFKLTDLTGLLEVEGFDKWTYVNTGTYEHDTSYYFIKADRMTNTAGVSQHVHIAIKKSVLRQHVFPISLDPADFSITKLRFIDEPSPISTHFTVNESMTIDKVEHERVYGSFSSSAPYGEQIAGRLLGLPFNWHCPLGGLLRCTFDDSQFNTTMFSWTGGGDFKSRLDPQTFKSVVAVFTLPVDVSTLEDNFVLLENNQPVKGRFEIKFYRVDFFPDAPLKPGATYTAKILTGIKNTYNDKQFLEEKIQEFEMICTGASLTDKLFNTATTIDVGEELDPGQSGTWSIRQGSGGQVTNATSARTTFSGQKGEVYTLRWAPSDAPCSHMTIDLRPVVADFEGNMYHEVKIGKQVWMGENLKSKVDAAGNAIPYDDFVGRLLYSWNAVMKGSPASADNPSGVQGVCPNGWHIPSAKEFEELMGVAAQDGRPIYDLLTTGTCQESIDLFGFGADNCGVEDYWSTTAGSSNGMAVMLMIRGQGYSNIVKLGDHIYGANNAVRCVKD